MEKREETKKERESWCCSCRQFDNFLPKTSEKRVELQGPQSEHTHAHTHTHTHSHPLTSEPGVAVSLLGPTESELLSWQRCFSLALTHFLDHTGLQELYTIVHKNTFTHTHKETDTNIQTASEYTLVFYHIGTHEYICIYICFYLFFEVLSNFFFWFQCLFTNFQNPCFTLLHLQQNEEHTAYMYFIVRQCKPACLLWQ